MIDTIRWNNLVSRLPGSHLLQTWEWGQLKAHFGWKPIGYVWFKTGPSTWRSSIVKFQSASSHQGGSKPLISDNVQFMDTPLRSSQPQAAALILQRDLKIGGFAAHIRIWYIPKGPLLDWANASLRKTVLDDLQKYARQSTAIFAKMDPDVPLGFGIPGQLESDDDPLGQEVIFELKQRGWLFSDEQIQFRNTVHLDLTLSEDELLQRMKSKTRYNIRLAQRKGVTIRSGSPADWNLLYRMYAETSLRDGFVIRDERYYRTLWDIFSKQPLPPDPKQPVIDPLIAEIDGKPIAAVAIYRFGEKAWYLSGMSVDTHREKMPNYLLQWEAIRRSKIAGCSIYDMWGAPEEFNPTDSLWGVYKFKEGFAGKVIRTLGAWDYPSHKTTYRLYTHILPRILDVMRRKGISRTKQITP